jgi:hypothetical protein
VPPPPFTTPPSIELPPLGSVRRHLDPPRLLGDDAGELSRTARARSGAFRSAVLTCTIRLARYDRRNDYTPVRPIPRALPRRVTR